MLLAWENWFTLQIFKHPTVSHQSQGRWSKQISESHVQEATYSDQLCGISKFIRSYFCPFWGFCLQDVCLHLFDSCVIFFITYLLFSGSRLFQCGLFLTTFVQKSDVKYLCYLTGLMNQQCQTIQSSLQGETRENLEFYVLSRWALAGEETGRSVIKK